MYEIQLTKKERLLLANQNRILAALYPNKVEQYNQLATALECGYPFFYGEVYFRESTTVLHLSSASTC
jgi:uncharacterized protein YfbU (UPF0304 family)